MRISSRRKPAPTGSDPFEQYFGGASAPGARDLASLVRLLRTGSPGRELEPEVWRQLVGRAFEHGLLPLLADALIACAPSVETTAVIALREKVRLNTYRSLALAAETVRLTRHLQAAGIRAIAFKGPILSQIAFVNIAYRQAGDIDLCVTREERQNAVDRLRGCGYALDPAWTPAIRQGHFDFDCECELENPELQMCIDLHWDFTAHNFSLPLPMERFFNRRAKIQWQGQEILTFAPEDQLLILCLHAAKHHWKRLEWCYTISKLIEGCPNLNWETALFESRQLQLTHIVNTGLLLCKQLFGSHLPEHIGALIDHDARARYLAATAMQWMGQDFPEGPSAFQVRCFHASGRPNWKARLSYWRGVIMTPTARDYGRQIPFLVKPFQIVLRIVRLLCEANGHLAGRAKS